MSKLIGVDDTNSSVFTIPNGGQVTLHATGLQGSDYIALEIVRTTDTTPGKGVCCPGPVSLAEIGWRQPLKLACGCGAPSEVRMTAEQPFVVLDTPQGIGLVAVKHTTQAMAQIEVFRYETNSKGHNIFAAQP